MRSRLFGARLLKREWLTGFSFSSKTWKLSKKQTYPMTNTTQFYSVIQILLNNFLFFLNNIISISFTSFPRLKTFPEEYYRAAIHGLQYCRSHLAAAFVSEATRDLWYHHMLSVWMSSQAFFTRVEDYKQKSGCVWSDFLINYYIFRESRKVPSWRKT